MSSAPSSPSAPRHGFVDRVPGLRRLLSVPRQLVGGTPFREGVQPTRVPVLFRSGRPSLPFPHPWNYQQPIDILASYFDRSERDEGFARHNRYLDCPGFPPVFVTRDPHVIRAVLTATGDRAGQFDRDTLPSTGIARATGEDTLLFGNGPQWRTQRKASAAPFGKTALFDPEIFSGFEAAASQTIRTRLALLRRHLAETGQAKIELAVEPEVKAIMLELLVHCFFGAEVDSEEVREVFVPAIERVITHIVRDTIVNPLGLPRPWLAKVSRKYRQAADDFATFERLTDLAIASRPEERGLWGKLKTDAPDAAIRSNVKVFLAGALEATTSYATWAISHLARHPEWQEQVYAEVEPLCDYTPDLCAALEETLRLTPALYFLPRRATQATSVTLPDEQTLAFPPQTHILLDVWHANRHDDHWGPELTGYAADVFEPERWKVIANSGAAPKEFLHFGFGHGARVCPGKHLGQLEVALVVGLFVKMFRFRAVNEANPVQAGVSTKPADGTLVELDLRPPSAGMTSEDEWSRELCADEADANAE